MKLSIITVCFNAEKTIGHTIESFLEQTHADREMILIDGASRDSTVRIAESFRDTRIHIHSEPDAGLYDAMNRGLTRFTGDAVGFLNADDCYEDENVLGDVNTALAHADIVSGNLDFVSDHNNRRVVRRWRGTPYTAGAFKTGWMPAHPTFYVRRRVVDAVGKFDLRYRISADYDYMLRAFEKNTFVSMHLDRIFVKMTAGGKSNSGIGAYIASNLEALQSRRQHLGTRIVDYALVAKPLRKIAQFVVTGSSR